MKTTAQFKKWLNEKIVWLQELPTERRNESEHSEALGLIDQAFQHATDLRLADAAAACRPGRVDVRLLECLAAIPESRTVLTPPEIGEQLGKAPETVIGWITSGQLKGSNLANSTRPQYVVSPDDLIEFLKNRQPQPVAANKRKAKPSPSYDRYQ